MLVEAYGFMTGEKASLRHTSYCDFIAPTIMQIASIVIGKMQSIKKYGNYICVTVCHL